MRWRIILRNIGSNWAGYLVTALIGFLLSPFIVHRLGTAGYGLWTLVLSLTGYFGLLDFGIRSSVGRFVARYVALNDHNKSNRVVSTAFAILLLGGSLALLATLVVAGFFYDSFNVEPQFQSAGRIALLITGVTMACTLPMGVFGSVLMARERYDISSGVTIVGELIRATLIVIFLTSGYGLVALALIASFVSVAQYSAMVTCAKKLYAPLHVSFTLVDRATFREVFSFGVYRFIWIVANQLIFFSSSIVIGIFLTTGTITYYAIAVSLINYGRTIVSLVTDTFYPAATRMDAANDFAGLRELLIVGTRISLLVALPLCIGYLFLGKQFITLWMGQEYSRSWFYLAILTIPQFTSMSQYVSALVLAAMAKHKMLAYLVMGEATAILILNVLLIRSMGLTGVAWATAIPDLICTAIIIPWYTLKVLKLSVREYVAKAFARPVLSMLPAAGLGYAFSILAGKPSWRTFGSEVAAMCGVVVVVSYFICLTSRQRVVAHDRIRSLFQRRGVIQQV